MLDQGVFVEFDRSGLKNVNLNEAPMDVQHYLKQVAADRNRCADIVVADMDVQKYDSNQTAQFKIEKTNAPKGIAPPTCWQLKQISDFSDLRMHLSRLRAKLKKSGQLPHVVFPEINNESGWKAFCTRKFSAQFLTPQIEKEISSGIGNSAALFKGHAGTPPLLKLVLSLPQPSIVDLLGFQVQWFQEENYKTHLMHWIFSLLCVLEKPLEPGTCSALRCLARHCATLRRALAPEDDMVREYSWFIAIVAKYFDQKDLADPETE